MRIAYISHPCFADCDLPLLTEMSKLAEVDFYLMIGKNSRQATLIDTEVKPKGGVFKASEYPALARLSEFMDIRNIYVINLPEGHDWSPENLKGTWRAMKFISRRKYDIVHTTNPFRYGNFMLYMLRRRMIMTMHDPIPHSSDMNRLNRMHRWIAFRLTDHFLLLNKTMHEEFVRTYGLQRKHVYESSLSIYTHLKKTVPVLPEEKGYVLFVGSINPHKGIEYLCEAMEKTHKEMPHLKLIVAGRGKFWFDVEKYRQQGFVKFINRFVTDEELSGLISNALIVVCPYIDATQSGVIMSAFALDKPVIATNVGALPEMLTHERHGLLVPPRDIDSLSNAILSLMSSPERLAKMAENINEDYSRGDRSWQHIARTYIEIYKKMLRK
ncbi:glycosyltransferase family 4 protein [Prevotella koreensis]